MKRLFLLLILPIEVMGLNANKEELKIKPKDSTSVFELEFGITSLSNLSMYRLSVGDVYTFHPNLNSGLSYRINNRYRITIAIRAGNYHEIADYYGYPIYDFGTFLSKGITIKEKGIICSQSLNLNVLLIPKIKPQLYFNVGFIFNSLFPRKWEDRFLMPDGTFLIDNQILKRRTYYRSDGISSGITIKYPINKKFNLNYQIELLLAGGGRNHTFESFSNNFLIFTNQITFGINL